MSLTWEEEQEILALGPNERREIVDALLRSIQDGDEALRLAAADRLSSLCIFGLVADVVPIEPLARWLGAADESLRSLAEYGLANTDGRALPTLIARLDDAVADVRISAASALAHTGDLAAIAASQLCNRLQDPVAQVRQRAAFALGLIHAIDEASVLALLEMSQSPEDGDRASAMHALGNVAQKLSDDSLRERLQSRAVQASEDPDGDTRWGAHFVLDSLEAPPDVRLAVIERGLRDAAPLVQKIAASGLKDLVTLVDLAPLEPALIALALGGDDAAGTAVEVLGQAGRSTEAVAAITEIATESGYRSVGAAGALWQMTRDAELVLPVLEREFEDNGESVCDLICLMGPAASPLLPRIMKALGDEDSYDLQWAAADALGAVASPDPEVVEALAHALDHPSGIVRGAATRALGRTGAVAVPLLLKHLAPPFSPSAEYVADALSRMGPSAISAVDALRTAHRQGEWGLRTWAAIALARIAADPEAVPDLLKIVESDDDNGPTQHAIEALAAVGPAARKALPALRKLQEHLNEEIAAAAEAAIASVASRTS